MIKRRTIAILAAVGLATTYLAWAIGYTAAGDCPGLNGDALARCIAMKNRGGAIPAIVSAAIFSVAIWIALKRKA
jgi:hypothetical protein